MPTQKSSRIQNLHIKLSIKRLLPILLFVGMMGATGAYLLARSNAATMVVAIEAESGTLSSRAIATNDANASNGVGVKFTAAPATARTIKLMPLGDSITLGSNGGYRTLLWKKLVQQDGKKIDFVGSLNNGPADLGDKDHEGHSGWRIDQLRANIDAWSATYKPELVLLHIGTNDMGQNYNVSTAPDRLKDLVNRICTNNPGVEVIVASIVPFSGLDSRVNPYNATIPGIVTQAKDSGCKATFFNMNQKLTTADLGDGVHPTVAGYNKMAEAWYAPAAEAYTRLTGQ